MVATAEVGLTGIDDPRILSWAVTSRRAVVTSNIQDFRPLHATHLTTGMVHCGIVLVPTLRYSLKRDRLGPLVTELDKLLARLPADDALAGREHFL